MTTDYKAYVSEVDRRLQALFKAAPGPMRAYAGLVQEVNKAGALDKKTKELMALSISIATLCEGCIAYHLRAAVGHGATRDEVLETIAVAVEMGGGPATVYGSMAFEALDQLSG
jgi:AhpD family alkylhydroperoxidase